MDLALQVRKTLLHTNNITFKDLEITHISKPILKHSYISVTKESKIIIKTPKVSDAYIQELLCEKEAWIRKQLLKLHQNPPVSIKLQKEVLLFGEVFSVDAEEFKTLKASLLRLKKPTKENVLKCYDRFYKEYASSYLTGRVECFSKIMHLTYNEIKFKKMKRRWGSCSSKGVITLNTRLLHLSKEQIDYVVVHELSHLVYMNHSKDFHTLVESYIPDAKRIRKEIRCRDIYL